MVFVFKFLAVFFALVFLGGGTGYGLYTYATSLFVVPEIQNSSTVGLKDPVIIRFKSPVITSNYREGIDITPKRPAYVKWNSNFTELSVEPRDFWVPGTQYTLSLPEGQTRMFHRVPSVQLSFHSIDVPHVLEISLADDARDVLLDMESPLTVSFDRSTEGFFVDFRLSPDANVVYENNAEKTVFKILPQDMLQNGMKYILDVFVWYSEDTDKNSVRVGGVQFTTLPPPPSQWSKNIDERVFQAKKFTRPKMGTGKYIDINISAQVLSTFENGELLDSFPISSGRRGMDTAKGQFAIHNKAMRPWSKQYSLYMPYWMALVPDGKVGIHELPEWPGGYKEGVNHLGIPVSHGCVRLGVGSAKKVFEWAEIGTPVIIY